MASESDILNLIADLRSNNEEREALEDQISIAEKKLAQDRDDLQDLEDQIERDREKLNELIDEATGRKDDNDGLGYGRPIEYY